VWRTTTTDVDLLVAWKTLALCRTRVYCIWIAEQTRSTSSPSPASVHVKRHEGLVRDMGVDGPPLQRGHVELWHALCKGMEMNSMGFESVRSCARSSNLIVAPTLESSRLFRNLMEEVEALFLGPSALFDHACQRVDFRSKGDHGGGENGIELTQLAYATREVEGKRIEGVTIL